MDYGGDELKLCESLCEGWEHKIADAEGGETCYGRNGILGRVLVLLRTEDEQEDLADVVVALEIGEMGLLA